MRNILTLITLLVLTGQAWGATYTKQVQISGTGSVESDYIVRLNLHWGHAIGDLSPDDVFLGEKSRTDFNDVRFNNYSGSTLSYYRHSYGNYEVVKDHHSIGSKNFIASDGSIYSTGVETCTGICKSTNNGQTWNSLYSSTESAMVFIDSLGNIFAGTSVGPSSGTHQIIKSSASDTAHTTWTSVLDMSASSGYALHTAMSEDSDGNLYFGRYQVANAVAIYKSTNHGDTWIDITPAGYTAQQHVHGVYVDKSVTPNAIYAGLDGASPVTIKSVNAGATWTNINSPLPANFNQMIAGNGYRVFSGEASVNGGYTLYRTTDDATYTPVVQTGQLVSGMQVLNGNLYAFGGSNSVNKYAQIYRSTDSGLTWQTIWTSKYYVSPDTSAGLRYATPYGIPSGQTEAQLLVGALDTGGEYYRHTRIFDGGDHHQAIFYIKIPTLPADGTTINIVYGGAETTTTSNISILGPVQQSGLLAHWNLNEGSGATVTDSSGNGKAATLTPGSGSWASEGRRAGVTAPPISQTGSSYHFNGDGHIRVTNSDTDPNFGFVKNFTYICWIRTTESSSALRWVMGRGAVAGGNYPLGITLRTNGSQLSLSYYTGTTQALEPTGAEFRKIALMDGGWHMLAVSVDNSTPPNATFSIDVQGSNAMALVADPLITSQKLFSIGAGSDGLQPFIGDIDDVQVYNRSLSQTEIRQIYENRKFAATEPIIDGLSYQLHHGDFNIDYTASLNNLTVTGDIRANADAVISNSITSGINIASGKTVTGTHNLFTASAKTGTGVYTDATYTLWGSSPALTSNYHLSAGSPAINAGTDVGLTTDADGLGLWGTAPDIGAYEWRPDTGSTWGSATAATPSVVVNNAALSGVTQMQFSNNGTTWSDAEAYSATKVWEVTPTDGRKAVYVRYGDAYGNWSAASQLNIYTYLTTAPRLRKPGWFGF
jgi:hypothetical protein